MWYRFWGQVSLAFLHASCAANSEYWGQWPERSSLIDPVPVPVGTYEVINLTRSTGNLHVDVHAIIGMRHSYADGTEILEPYFEPNWEMPKKLKQGLANRDLHNDKVRPLVENSEEVWDWRNVAEVGKTGKPFAVVVENRQSLRVRTRNMSKVFENEKIELNGNWIVELRFQGQTPHEITQAIVRRFK